MIEIPADWRDRYLTVEMAAAVVAMSPKAMYNMIHRGQGPELVRIGRRIRISGSALARWAEGHVNTAKDESLPVERTRNVSLVADYEG